MLNPKLFPMTQHLRNGQRVRYRLSSYGEGEGVIELIWLGVDEMVDIRRTDGKLVRACPALKDEIVRIGVEPLCTRKEGILMGTGQAG